MTLSNGPGRIIPLPDDTSSATPETMTHDSVSRQRTGSPHGIITCPVRTALYGYSSHLRGSVLFLSCQNQLAHFVTTCCHGVA